MYHSQREQLKPVHSSKRNSDDQGNNDTYPWRDRFPSLLPGVYGLGPRPGQWCESTLRRPRPPQESAAATERPEIYDRPSSVKRFIAPRELTSGIKEHVIVARDVTYPGVHYRKPDQNPP